MGSEYGGSRGTIGNEADITTQTMVRRNSRLLLMSFQGAFHCPVAQVVQNARSLDNHCSLRHNIRNVLYVTIVR